MPRKQSIKTGCVFAFSAILLCLCVLPLKHAQGQPQSRLISHAEVKALPSKEKRWALIIGIDKYEDQSIASLRGGTNDAKALSRALQDYAGFNENQIILLTNEQTRGRQPTRLNILRYLSNLKSSVPKDGLLLVSFSGHGVSRDGRAFLIPSDAVFTDDFRLLQQTALSIDNLISDIKEIKVGQVLVFLDACRSDPLTDKADSINPLTEAYVRAFDFTLRNHEVTAFATLFATSVGSRAYESPLKAQGYFTIAVTEGLSGRAANPTTGEVTLQSLIKYVESTVPAQVSAEFGGRRSQRPFAIIEGYQADELVLAVGSRITLAGPQPPNFLSGERALWQDVEKSNVIEAYEAYIKAYPKGEFSAVATFRLARLKEMVTLAAEYYKRGYDIRFNNRDEALKSFSKAIELNPRYADAYRERGYIHYHVGQQAPEKYELALTDYNKAIELNPNEDSTYNLRGLLYSRKGDYTRAIADYTRSIDLAPNKSAALFNRAGDYVAIGRFDQAINDYTAALERQKIGFSASMYYNARGKAYLAQKDYGRAIADFNKAIEIESTEEQYYDSRGTYYLELREYGKAIADFTRAIDLLTPTAHIGSYRYYLRNFHKHRAEAFLASGQHDQAIADFTKAIELGSDDASVYRGRAKAYEAKGNQTKAKMDKTKATEIGGSSRASILGTGSAINPSDVTGGLPLNLEGYCKTTYGPSSRVAFLENHAYGWRCETEEKGQKRYVSIDMNEACKKQYGPSASATFRRYERGGSWYCVK